MFCKSFNLNLQILQFKDFLQFIKEILGQNVAITKYTQEITCALNYLGSIYF